MRIGVMLRHLDQHGGGVRVYTENLLRHLSSIGGNHEFVHLYRSRRHLGSYAGRANVREMACRSPSALLWDQVAVPKMAGRADVDVIFNPKYSLPLDTAVRTAFVCHGLDWYVMPHGSRWRDRLSHRLLIPRYAQTADRIIAVSDTARAHVIEYLGVPEDRVKTVYHGVDRAFAAPVAMNRQLEIARRYQLPAQFFLYCGQIYPPKNFGRLIRAFARVGPPRGISLVVAGTHTWLCKDEIALIDELKLRPWVVGPRWVERDALPTLYQRATALVVPSLYDACCLPILEAMAAGCPIVTAARYGTAELAGPAAILVDAEDVESITDGMTRVLEDDGVRKSIVSAGQARAKHFSWARCARGTLEVLEELRPNDAVGTH